ncbi:MAG: hypothetical protein A2V98_05495 [Planctomycetes bacterium RBG_16_64_12]|nr:MAG: hypothetical protein A2V98_05495 [Planctomycetes bacterium RBG_16_64_12]
MERLKLGTLAWLLAAGQAEHAAVDGRQEEAAGPRRKKLRRIAGRQGAIPPVTLHSRAGAAKLGQWAAGGRQWAAGSGQLGFESLVKRRCQEIDRPNMP